MSLVVHHPPDYFGLDGVDVEACTFGNDLGSQVSPYRVAMQLDDELSHVLHDFGEGTELLKDLAGIEWGPISTALV